MSDSARSILLGTSGLSATAGVALLLTLARRVGVEPYELRSAARIALITTACQAGHFLEELASGFHRRFPELFGLAPWSARFFVAFNLTWLAIWVLSARGLLRRRRAALFPLWFLALGALGNLVAHPLFALRAGGYFPGLVTAPFVGCFGLLLARALLRVTQTTSNRAARPH